MSHRFLILVFVGLATLMSSGDICAEPRSFDLGQWGVLETGLPAGWVVDQQVLGPNGVLNVLIRPPADVELALMLSIFPFRGDASRLDGIRGIVERSASEIKEVSVEKEIPIQSLEGPGCQGFYFSATDRRVDKPTATELRLMDQGLAAIGRLGVTFTLLRNVVDAPERDVALGIVQSALHRPPGPPWRTTAGSYALAGQGRNWRLVLDLPGFEIGPLAPTAAPQGVSLRGTHSKTGMNVSVFLEPAHEGWTAVDHREDYWKKISGSGSIKRKQVKRTEQNGMALLEFFIPEFESVPVRQKSINAFLVRDGLWIDVHLSKDQFEKEDQKLFEKVVASIRFEE